MIKRTLSIVIFIALIVSITACGTNIGNKDISQNENNIDEKENNGKDNGKNNTEIEYELTEKGIIKSEFAKKIIEEVSNELINAISIKDFKTVSKFTHPVKGVRFTPYTNVSLEQDIVFSREEIKISLIIGMFIFGDIMMV